jgi:xanthine dehydrogenase YagS FAD-binding subunit
VQAFAFTVASTLDEALYLLSQPGSHAIAGGTELLNWMKEGIEVPDRLVDISQLPGLDGIVAGPDGLRVGALARMSDVAEDESVVRDYAAVSEALMQSASPQLRNMASMGGNLMQRTRCPYFRAEVDLPCNKRRPRSGCSALESGEDRRLAIFGGSKHCIATHPSDVAVALAALDAVLETQNADGGGRTVPLLEFYRLPGDAPESDTVLQRGELITAIVVPSSRVARRSHYLKVRERTSYEFALVSAAVAFDSDGSRIREARVALGGVAPKPWRLPQAEAALPGIDVADGAGLRAAIEPSFAEARPGRRNGFKLELAARTIVRELQSTGGVA